MIGVVFDGNKVFGVGIIDCSTNGIFRSKIIFLTFERPDGSEGLIGDLLFSKNTGLYLFDGEKLKPKIAPIKDITIGGVYTFWGKPKANRTRDVQIKEDIFKAWMTLSKHTINSTYRQVK